MISASTSQRLLTNECTGETYQELTLCDTTMLISFQFGLGTFLFVQYADRIENTVAILNRIRQENRVKLIASECELQIVVPRSR